MTLPEAATLPLIGLTTDRALADRSARRSTRVVVQEVHADGGRLTELAALVDASLLTLGVADTYPLAGVARAHERLATGGLRGRLVLVP